MDFSVQLFYTSALEFLFGSFLWFLSLFIFSFCSCIIFLISLVVHVFLYLTELL